MTPPTRLRGPWDLHHEHRNGPDRFVGMYGAHLLFCLKASILQRFFAEEVFIKAACVCRGIWVIHIRTKPHDPGHPYLRQVMNEVLLTSLAATEEHEARIRLS